VLVLFAILYNVSIGHQDHAVGGAQVQCVNAEPVSPSSNLGQRYIMLFVLLLSWWIGGMRCALYLNGMVCYFVSFWASVRPKQCIDLIRDVFDAMWSLVSAEIEVSETTIS
jgi:hypothetical protein